MLSAREDLLENGVPLWSLASVDLGPDRASSSEDVGCELLKPVDRSPTIVVQQGPAESGVRIHRLFGSAQIEIDGRFLTRLRVGR